MAAASKSIDQTQGFGIEPLLIYDSVRAYNVLVQLAELAKEFSIADASKNPTMIRRGAFENFCKNLSYSGIEPNDLLAEIEKAKRFLSSNGLDLNRMLLDLDPGSQKFPCGGKRVAALVDGIGFMDSTLNDLGERKLRLHDSKDVNWDNFYSEKGTVWDNAGKALKLTSSRKRDFVVALGEAVMANSIRLYYCKHPPTDGEKEFEAMNSKEIFTYMNTLATIAKSYGINPASIELLDLSGKMAESAFDSSRLENSKADALRMLAKYLSEYLAVKSEAADAVAKAFIGNKRYWLPEIARAKTKEKPGNLSLDAYWKKGDAQLQVPRGTEQALAEAVSAIIIPNSVRAYASSNKVMVYSTSSKQEADKSGEILEYVMEYFLDKKAITEFENTLRVKQIDPSKIRLLDASKFAGEIAGAQSKEERNEACRRMTDALADYLVGYLGIDHMAAIEVVSKYSSFEHSSWTALRRGLLEKKVPEKRVKEKEPLRTEEKPPSIQPATAPRPPIQTPPSTTPSATPPAAPAPQTPPAPQQAATPAAKPTTAPTPQSVITPPAAPAAGKPSAAGGELAPRVPQISVSKSEEIKSKLWGSANMHVEVVNMVSMILADAVVWRNTANYLKGTGAPEEQTKKAEEKASAAERALVTEVTKETAAMKADAPDISMLDLSQYMGAYANAGSAAEGENKRREMDNALSNYLARYAGTDRAASIAKNCIDQVFEAKLLRTAAKQIQVPLRADGETASTYWQPGAGEMDQGVLELRPDSSIQVGSFVTLSVTSAEISVLDSIIAACGKSSQNEQKAIGIAKRTYQYMKEMKSRERMVEAVKNMRFGVPNVVVKRLSLKEAVSDLIMAQTPDLKVFALRKIDERLTSYLEGYMKLPHEVAKRTAVQNTSLISTLIFGTPSVEIAEKPVSSGAVPVPTKTVGEVGIRRGADQAAIKEKEERVQKERALIERLGLGDSIKAFTTERTGAVLEGDALRYEVRVRPGAFPSIHTGTSFFLEGGVLDTYMAMKKSGKTLERKNAMLIETFGPRMEEARKIAAELVGLDKSLEEMSKGFKALELPK